MKYRKTINLRLITIDVMSNISETREARNILEGKTTLQKEKRAGRGSRLLSVVQGESRIETNFSCWCFAPAFSSDLHFKFTLIIRVFDSISDGWLWCNWRPSRLGSSETKKNDIGKQESTWVYCIGLSQVLLCN